MQYTDFTDALRNNLRVSDTLERAIHRSPKHHRKSNLLVSWTVLTHFLLGIKQAKGPASCFQSGCPLVCIKETRRSGMNDKAYYISSQMKFVFSYIISANGETTKLLRERSATFICRKICKLGNFLPIISIVHILMLSVGKKKKKRYQKTVPKRFFQKEQIKK